MKCKSKFGVMILTGMLIMTVLGCSNQVSSVTNSSDFHEDGISEIIKESTEENTIEDSDDLYIYHLEGAYEAIKGEDLSGINFLDYSNTTDINGDAVLFSPDKKYIYYYRDYYFENHTNYNRGTLCRIECDKISEVTDGKNEYSEIISKDVIELRFFDNGTFVYNTLGGLLYYFNDTESILITDSVQDFEIDEKNRIFFTKGNTQLGYELYGVVVSDFENIIKFSENVFSIQDDSDFNNLIYYKKEGDRVSVYTSGFDNEEKKMTDSIVNVFGDDDGNDYYLVDSGDTICPEDLLPDDVVLSEDKNENCSIKKLYCVKEGKWTVLCDNVLNARKFDGIIFYNTIETIKDKIQKEGDLNIDNFRLNFGDKNYILLTQDGIEAELSENAKEFLKKHSDSYFELSCTDSHIYLYNQESISVARIENGVIHDFNQLDVGNIGVYGLEDSVLYYHKYEKNVDPSFFCFDVYAINGNSIEQLAENGVTRSVNLYEDDVVLAFTNRSQDGGYELSIFKKNEERIVIGDKVSQYVRVDNSKILFISMGNLYLYDGKESVLIREGVDYVWSLKTVDIKDTF